MSPGLGTSTMRYAIAKVTIGSTISTATAAYSPRRSHFQLICPRKLGFGERGGPPGGPPPPGGRRGGAGGGCFGGGVPSSAALTTSIGSRRCGGVVARTAGKTVVNRSSGGTPSALRREGPSWRRCWPGPTPSAARPMRTSLADRSWRPSLFTGRARATARRPRATRSLWRRDGAEYIRLDQVIPTAGAAYLHHVYGKLVVSGRQQDQLLGGSGRT